MMPAGLTSSLLVREGEAKQTSCPEAPSDSLVPSRPADAAPSGPVAPCAPMAEILVPAQAPRQAAAGSDRPGRDDRVNLAVRIDRKLHNRLRLLAARQQRTHQDIVEGALEAYLAVFGAGCACVPDPNRQP